ncbi:hypothetical protein GV794_08430 [Nocardia cyriacigeorgica]|uniref:SMI1/KNR4 family protein n=1 Tax=Nocardia cyriacigeorgica TaxID=135487 RepID=A0A6P1D5K1_9NOCA|nr:SMI1/KNR4 family protein [Nocardia cyriacigeorgica]NEW45906.1 hypothetical protein [Nocardia cyriacigeorgica]NEW55677.1 hypothetical protein [Nocardia cyriacigeorgica]
MTALERRLGTTMPPGYAEFMATYGEGSICDALYAWGPDRILESLDAARESWGESWFWEHPDLVPADFAAAVPVGASPSGDQVALVPGRGLVVLPRHSDDVIEVGTSYTDLVRWCTSGRLGAAHEVLWFESWAQQSCLENWSGGELDQVQDAIAGLALHVALDASRTDARTFLIPAMGGHVFVLRTSGDGDLYVHVRFEPEYVTPYARVAAALLAVGSTRDGRWGAEPTA